MTLLIPTSDDRPVWDIWLSSLWLPSLTAALELSIFETLATGPARADELAAGLGLRPQRCEILLRMQVSLGFLKLYMGRYHLSDTGRLYLLQASPFYWGHVWRNRDDNPAHTRLLEAVRNPAPRASTALGESPSARAWESGQLGEELAGEIARFMHSHSMAASVGLAVSADFRGVRKLLDVGGGSGCFSIALAQQWPDLSCTIMDLPAMCTLAEEYVAQAGVADRVDARSVDMFREPWPRGYDVIFLSNIFHDWSPETCVELATNARNALPQGGRICLHEMLLDDAGTGPRTAAAFSVLMLMATKGQQFTLAELKNILDEAGFVDLQVVPTYGDYSLVSARVP